MVRRSDMAELQGLILMDIEAGICTVQCAGAVMGEATKCRCTCRGDNHGKLWLPEVSTKAAAA